MTKNRIVKYAANTALLAVLAAAGIGVYQIGTYTPDKEIQEEQQTDQSEDNPFLSELESTAFYVFQMEVRQ